MNSQTGKPDPVLAPDKATPVMGAQIASELQMLMAQQYGESAFTKRQLANDWYKQVVAAYGCLQRLLAREAWALLRPLRQPREGHATAA